MKHLLRLILFLLTLILLGAGALIGWAHLQPKPPLLEGVKWSSAVCDRDGRLLRLTLSEDGMYRLPVRIPDVSRETVEATLRYEDKYYYEHPGVNPFALARAAWDTWRGPRSIGASTVTMQVARRLQNINTRTFSGKVDQILWALRYDAHYSKDEILAAYFSLAPYGGNVEGIEAAAEVYFGKHAAMLGTAESIALSVVPQNPVKRHPVTGADFEKARLKAGEAALAGGFVSERLAPSVRGPLTVLGTEKLPFEAPHFTRLVSRLNSAPTVRTTLSLPLNKALEGILRQSVERLSAYGISNGALTVVDTRTMEVLAHVGSVDFFSNAIAGEVDGVLARRSPGSTLKPFIYGLALDQGLIHSRSVLVDAPKNFRGYVPENADRRFRGPLPATDALNLSRNVPAIALAQQLKPDLYDFLNAAGAGLRETREHYGLSIVLGGAEIRMNTLAALYSSLNTGGILKPLRRLTDSGDDASGRALLSPEAAWIVRSMLLEGGETVSVEGVSVPLLWKTGTSNGYRDAWTAGLAGPYAVVVWLGNFSGRSSAYLQGAAAAQPLFRSVAMRVLTDRAFLVDQAAVDRMYAKPDGVTEEDVCRSTGDLAKTPEGAVRCADTVKAWFIPGKSPIRDTGILREILIDEETGLRACREIPGRTRRVVWEFWPTHYQETFLAAGIVKRPPPAWTEGCGGNEPPVGAAPVIVSPRAGTVYFAGTADRQFARMTLEAGTEPDVRVVYWFADGSFVGAVKAGKPLVWKCRPGTVTVTAVDDRGRRTSRTVTIRQP